MSIQQVQLEEVQMDAVSDEALEQSVGIARAAGTGTGFTVCFLTCV